MEISSTKKISIHLDLDEEEARGLARMLEEYDDEGCLAKKLHDSILQEISRWRK